MAHLIDDDPGAQQLIAGFFETAAFGRLLPRTFQGTYQSREIVHQDGNVALLAHDLDRQTPLNLCHTVLHVGDQAAGAAQDQGDREVGRQGQAGKQADHYLSRPVSR